jgi:hypothetical protein
VPPERKLVSEMDGTRIIDTGHSLGERQRIALFTTTFELLSLQMLIA